MADVGEITKTAAKSVQKNPTGLAAAGAALVALPYAAQGVAKLAGKAREKADPGTGKLAEIGDRASGKVTEKAKEVAGDVAGDKLKPKGLGSLLGGALGSGDSDDEDPGERDATGSGRRMPVQQSVDVAAPLKATYNLWTQFEEWPTYMHRVDSVQQDDDCTVTISTKAWGMTRHSKAQIVEQRPDERIEWDVEDGLAHTGVVTFHELAPRLTRIEITLDVQPEGLVEKMARGMRFTKRAVRGDLHRFKAHAEMQEDDDGGWRGTIEDGELKRKTDRKPAARSRSGSRASRSRNGSSPSSGSAKSGSRN